MTWKPCHDASVAGLLADELAQLDLGVLRHGAAGVRDDEDALDVEQVHAEDEGLERGRGHATAGVAEDLGVTGGEAEHAERVDARVHAGHDGDAAVGDAVEAAERERLGEAAFAARRSSNSPVPVGFSLTADLLSWGSSWPGAW